MILHEEFADAKQVSIPLGFGSNGVVSSNTAKMMIKVINKYFYHPYVRYVAEMIVEKVEDRDEVGEASAIFNFVQMNTRYGRDPRGREYFQSPVRALKRIEAGEKPTLDCDCMTILSLSLLRSLGYQTAIRIAGYTPKKKFVHVYGRVLLVIPDVGKKWVNFDAVRKGSGLGWEGAGVTIKKDFIIK